MKLERHSTVSQASARWAFGRDRPHAFIDAAVTSMEREGLSVREVSLQSPPFESVRNIAVQISDGKLVGSVIFSHVPSIVTCIANKVPGVRAVMVSTVGQAALASIELSANMFIVEMPGRTYYEIKQFLRVIHDAKPELNSMLARILEELDGRAHR